MFRIGSTSTMFAALSVLKLVEEGRLSLDDRVADLAPVICLPGLTWHNRLSARPLLHVVPLIKNQ
jgi:CubicO group peptidase (beta-lactamase class C family)